LGQSEVRKVEFTANPTQRKFIESRAEADLFDCRKGEGKSAALCWASFYHVRHNPGATHVFIRDTWENLRRTTLQEFFFWFPPGVFGEWHKGDKEFVWNTAATGLKGKVIFMGVETEEDATKIASMPLAGVFVDEPSAAAGESSGVSEFVFDTAFAQLRQPGMKWYAAKLAQNNPDESHWTYRRFWEPGTPATGAESLLPEQEAGFRAWQTTEPENVKNLPPGYYDRMERTWAHRPDLLRRFVQGKHGYQQVGRPVTPEWSDELHLSKRLEPVKGVPLQLLWDGGLNPTCIITQVTPMGRWLILEAHVGEEIGAFELIRDVVKPRLVTKYAGFEWRHIGDPAMSNREQSSSMQSAKKCITKELGGPFIAGVKGMERLAPLQEVLRRTTQGSGMVLVDKDKAKLVWWALRGGWHYHVSRGGQIGHVVKDVHSHPGDAMSYGASILFPLGRLKGHKGKHAGPKAGGYYNTSPGHASGTSMGMARPGAKLPPEAKKVGG
jgi:hypothetical protein